MADDLVARLRNTTVRVYKYGLCPPRDWGDDCDAEAARMRAFWDRLVAIGADHDARVAAIMADGGQMAEIGARIEAAMAVKDKPAIKQASIERKELAARLRAERKPLLAMAEADRREAVKTARQQSGLYWGNYNAILQSYDAARDRAMKSGGVLHPSRDTDDLRFVVQLQRKGRVEQVQSGECSELSITPPSGEGSRKSRHHGSVTMVAHNTDGPRRVTWPMMMHRPLPVGGVITGAQIVRRRRAGLDRARPWYDWHICITVREPEQEAEPAREALAGINIGWRRRYRQSGLVTVGDGLRIAMIWDGRRSREIVLPERIIDMARRCDELTSAIDDRINDSVTRLLAANDAPASCRDEILTAERVTIGALEALAAAWPDAPEWLRMTVTANRRDARERAGVNRRLPRARLDVYRRAAKEIAATFARVAICDVDWAALARRRDPKRDELNPLPQPARGYRKIAAPGEFEAELRRALKAAGRAIDTHDEAMTPVCHVCGSSSHSTGTELVRTCGACGTSWDIDANAAKNLYAASAAMATNPAAALAGDKSEAYEGRFQRAKRKAAEARAALADARIDATNSTA